MTIAIAFQRMKLLIRRSSSRLPGYGGCLSAGIVLTYGVVAVNGSSTPLRMRRLLERREQLLHALRALALEHVVERLEPLGRLGGIGVVRESAIECSMFSRWP